MCMFTITSITKQQNLQSSCQLKVLSALLTEESYNQMVDELKIMSEQLMTTARRTFDIQSIQNKMNELREVLMEINKVPNEQLLK